MRPSRARFAEVMRTEPVDLGLACVLVGGEVDHDLDVEGPLAVLDALASAAEPLVPPAGAPAAVAEGLRRALCEQAGFGPGSFDDVSSSLLHEVLRRRCGLPLLLSVVWVEVATRLAIPAYAVGLPGRVVVAIGSPDSAPVYVDPYGGGRLVPPEQLAELAGTPLLPEHLAPLSPGDLLLRLLTNVRALTAGQPPSLSSTATRLWAVELSLLLPRHPLALRRERGELMVRLGDHLGGARELERYALMVGVYDEPAAAVVHREARQARAQLN